MTGQSPGSSISWQDWTIMKHRLELSDFFSFRPRMCLLFLCHRTLEKALMRQPCNDSGGSKTAFWREIIPQECSAFKEMALERILVPGEDMSTENMLAL